MSLIGKGLKFEAKCDGTESIDYVFYNYFDEDQNCEQGYTDESIINGILGYFAPITVTNDECFAMEWARPPPSLQKSIYYKFKIEPTVKKVISDTTIIIISIASAFTFIIAVCLIHRKCIEEEK